MDHLHSLAVMARTLSALGAAIAVCASLAGVWWVRRNANALGPGRSEARRRDRRYAGVGR